ncbi:vesicle-associated membrane protein 2-like [Melitaea cinxia]|uniref:vesicle-associated membrane protein 2-like n=1 Tax=Melitaea cinxia TaxID=113334 RepID=UPI001E26F91F|nr:vesicle-associated membrane protein 2-like [Melitaea cinxia]
MWLEVQLKDLALGTAYRPEHVAIAEALDAFSESINNTCQSDLTCILGILDWPSVKIKMLDNATLLLRQAIFKEKKLTAKIVSAATTSEKLVLKATEGGLAPSSDDMPAGGPKTPQQIAAQRRLQQTQAQVDEVVDIMKTNVEKVLERDQKLSELDDRADALQQGASQFEQQAGKLKSKFWLQNLKMMIIAAVIGIIILALIIGE